MSAEVTDEHFEIYSHISFMRLVSLVMTRAQDLWRFYLMKSVADALGNAADAVGNIADGVGNTADTVGNQFH